MAFQTTTLPLLLFLFLVCHHACSSSPSTPITGDRKALLSLTELLSETPTSTFFTSWNDSVHHCRWPRVICGGRKHLQRVIALQLDSLALNGLIPQSISNLTFLRYLNLAGNRLHGDLPKELGHLPRLWYLNLSMNSLQGELPAELGSLQKLRYMILDGNQLQGQIPSSIGNLSLLTSLSLSYNNLSGSIPDSFDHLSSLTYFDLSYNSLTGSIPSSIGMNSLQGELPAELVSLQKLRYMILDGNKLKGRIPSSIGNLSLLTCLSLSNNSLSGSIPDSFGRLSSLTYFDLSYNNLTGSIPSSLWNLSSLTQLAMTDNQISATLPVDIGYLLPRLTEINLSKNRFYGPIPSSLSNASSLEVVQLTNNSFSGRIPESLGTLKSLFCLHLQVNNLEAKDRNDWKFIDALNNNTKLKRLDLSVNRLGGALPSSIGNLSRVLEILNVGDNQISGRIPEEMVNLVSLNTLRMDGNHLSGPIPNSLGMLPRLQGLVLDDNHLTGEIPLSFGNRSQMARLSLRNNELIGSIPANLGRHLEFLSLEKNKLTGGIPREIFSITSLSRGLYLSDNSLTGPIPLEVGSLKSLQAFHVSNNNLSGELPSTLGDCQSLESLSMGGNSFHGSIPSTLGNLKGIKILDISHNSFFGDIPQFLEELKYLNYLNLSFNSFSGEVPTNGVFANESRFSILGNNQLCGGIMVLKLPPCPLQAHSKNRHGFPTLPVLIPTVCAFICLIIFISCLLTARCRRKPKLLNNKQGRNSELLNDLHVKVSYSELAKATEGFSMANLIGVGSFGSVYKGVLRLLEDEEAKLVAVKVLNMNQKGACKSFISECEALKSIRHRNLVRIITACSSVDFIGNDFKALVYEFMPNGSLDHWLQSDQKNLSLMQRMNIAIDVASALEYLHHHSQTPIVHCDLKPSNILLDDEMSARLADFGLSKFAAFENCSSSTSLKGSIGYAAPEYGMANRVSTHGDVYSYGILLLEMFTGMSPTGNNFKDGWSLRKFVCDALPERVGDVIDARLLEEEEEEDGCERDCIVSVLRTGILCSEESPLKRSQMKDVSKEMHAIRDALFLVVGGKEKLSNTR